MGIARSALEEVGVNSRPHDSGAPASDARSDIREQRISRAPNSTAQLRALHERFICDPADTDLSSLRPVIAQSWQRSLQWNVRPELRTFEEYRQPRVDEQLLRCAKPVLDSLQQISADTGATIYVADQDGTIAAVLGDERVAAPGTAMAEDITGTNSDGTALEEGRAVQVWGAEHFCEGMQHLYCTSVPVLDPLRRSVRALLSLSMPERLVSEADARSMVLIAQGAASELTQLLAARLAAREQALLASYLAEIRKRGADSVVVMDDRTTIASKGALHMLGQSDYAVLAGYARESERLDEALEREVTVGPGTMLQVHARPITSAGETIGSVIRLRPPKAAKTVSPRQPNARRTDRFDALVGESTTLRRALDVAGTVVRRRMPAYIIGEHGTGKSTLADAMAAQLAQDVVTLDCARQAVADRAVIARLRRELTAGSAVVLRHADALKPEMRAMVADLLGAFESPPVVLTMSSLRDEAMQLTNALGGVEIEMPPLRNRRDDIPLLVAHFLASAPHGVMRVSPPLMRALTEADWSGNVAQLKDFVDTAAARCNFSELGTQHLSEAHRRVIARNPLSRLEEAELQQIREALAGTDGNRVRAAELLQIGRSTLYRKIETYTRRGYNLEG
jgi:sigma-54 dependent transcriptional regulator, acetoin dehydrogenase operon transcriptional activator AcoR